MTARYVASFDFGTSGVKASLVDFEGEVCGASSVNYRLLTPQPGWAEQDPAAYWEACCRAAKQAMERVGAAPKDVRGIAFGTHWKGIIPLDGQGRVLHNAVIWLDGRAGEQAEKLNRRLGTDAMFNREYWPRLMWIRENMPKLYAETACFLEVNAYMKFKATGVQAADPTNHFTRADDPDLQLYYDRILAAAELDPAKFPPLVRSTERVGTLTREAADQLGLAEGTPVFGGCGDIPAIAIGAGCGSVGASHIYLGSSGWLGTVVPRREDGVGELSLTFERDKDLTIWAMQSACMSFNWAIDLLYRAEKETMGDGIFDYVNAEAASVPPGSDRLLAAPWIHGELRPLSEHTKALFFNVTGRHERRHFISAVMEGIGYMLRWKLELFREQTGSGPASIRVVGGGACSAPWMQRLADILGIPVHIPGDPRHAGAVGTAYCALIGLGVCGSFQEADARIRIRQTYLPDPATAPTYDLLYGAFRRLYPSLASLYEELNVTADH